MTGAQFRRIRERLDAALFQDLMPKRRAGSGRPPAGTVTQGVLAAYLDRHERTVRRWETAEREHVPALVAREMLRLRDVSAAPRGRGRRAASRSVRQ